MLQDIKQRRMANAILKLAHECDAGMKQGVQYYRAALATGDTVEATNLLKRAVRLPYRVEARIQELVTKHGAPVINQALSLVSSVTLGDISTEINALKAYSDTLKTNYQLNGWTLDQIADDIEANRADIDTDEIAPIPVSYTDDM